MNNRPFKALLPLLAAIAAIAFTSQAQTEAYETMETGIQEADSLANAIAVGEAPVIAVPDTAGIPAVGLDAILSDLAASYTPWHSAEFEGKLRQADLPVTPTVRMYMVCDSLIQLSLRAPLVGEVARLQLTKEELLIVNKLKKQYCLENPSALIAIYPTLIDDIQSIFLARVTVLGKGELSEANMSMVDVEENPGGGYLVIPHIDMGDFQIDYSYLVGDNLRTESLDIGLTYAGSARLGYSYANRGEQIDVALQVPGKKIRAELGFTSVKWGGTEMSPPRLDGYTRLGIKDFFSKL